MMTWDSCLGYNLGIGLGQELNDQVMYTRPENVLPFKACEFWRRGLYGREDNERVILLVIGSHGYC